MSHRTAKTAFSFFLQLKSEHEQQSFLTPAHTSFTHFHRDQHRVWTRHGFDWFPTSVRDTIARKVKWEANAMRHIRLKIPFIRYYRVWWWVHHCLNVRYKRTFTNSHLFSSSSFIEIGIKNNEGARSLARSLSPFRNLDTECDFEFWAFELKNIRR